MSASHRIKVNPPAAAAGLDIVERQAAAGREHVAWAAEATARAAAGDGDGFGRNADHLAADALRRAAALLSRLEQLARDAELTIAMLVAHDRAQIRFAEAPAPPIEAAMGDVAGAGVLHLTAPQVAPSPIAARTTQPPTPSDPLDDAVDELFARQDILIDMVLANEIPPEQLAQLALEPGECTSSEFEAAFWNAFVKRHPELDPAKLRDTPGYEYAHADGMAGLLLAALGSAAWLRFQRDPGSFGRGTPVNDTLLAYASAYSEYFPRLTTSALLQQGYKEEFDKLVDEADLEELTDDERMRYVELQGLMGGVFDTDAPLGSGAQPISGSAFDTLAPGLAAGLAKKLKSGGSAAAVAPTPLRPNEGKVGTYSYLRKRVGTKGDDLTPHHIPSHAYMMSRKIPGYKHEEGISIMMDHPYPGVGGRHRLTETNGGGPDYSLTPRQALARDVWDARSIYRREGLYTPKIRQGLREVILQNKRRWTIFQKPLSRH